MSSALSGTSLWAVKLTDCTPVIPVSMMSAWVHVLLPQLPGVKRRSNASEFPAADGSVSAWPVVSCMRLVPSGLVLQMFLREGLTKAIRPFVPKEGTAPSSLIFVCVILFVSGLSTNSLVGGKHRKQPVGPRL